MSLRLSGLYIYPLKSARGTALKRAEITSLGLAYDRRWMIVDVKGQFITQREWPQLAQLEVNLDVETAELELSLGQKRFVLPLPVDENYPDAEVLQVQVWRSQVVAQACSRGADQWLSDLFQTECRLVYMPQSTYRPTNPDRAPGKRVSFADGYPYLITLEASLNDLNSRMTNAIPMDRFRSNLVIEGGEAFEEDRWQSFRIGKHHFIVAKPCERCVMTTLDQHSGQRGHEPLKTLAQYRKQNGKIIFGQNLYAHSQSGFLELGQPIEDLVYRD